MGCLGWNVALCLMLATPAAARGASFECGFAATPREKAVCSDSSLSDLDGELDDRYRAALGHLSIAGRASLIRDQRDWLRFLDRACSTVDGIARNRSTPLADCLQKAYRGRSDDLAKAGVRIGPFTFSRVDRYDAQPDDAGNEPRLAIHHIAYPVIDRPATAITRRWNEMSVRKDEASSCDGGVGDVTVGYDMGLVTPGLIGTTRYVGEYCHGTPHGFGVETAETMVLAPQPHSMQPEDLFRTGGGWQARLRSLLIAALCQAAGQEATKNDPANCGRNDLLAAAVAVDPNRWSVQAAGIRFDFQKWELKGPPIFGNRVVVPWSDLRDVTRPDIVPF